MWEKETILGVENLSLSVVSLTSYLTQNKSMILSGPQLPPPLNGDNTVPDSL